MARTERMFIASLQDPLVGCAAGRLWGRFIALTTAQYTLSIGLGVLAGLALVQDAPVFISIAMGIPALIMIMLPSSRKVGLLGLLVLLPVATYVKAFTGYRYGPATLDCGVALLCFLALADRALSGTLRIKGPEVPSVAFILIGVTQILNPSSPGLFYALEGFRILVLPVFGLLIGLYLPMEKADLRRIIGVLVLTVALVAAFGIYQWFFPSRFDARVVFETTGDPSTYTSLGAQRAFSTLPSPGHLAYLLAFGTIASAALLDSGRKPYAPLLGIAIMTVCSVLTIIRTGWIGTCVGLGTYLVCCGWKRRLGWSVRILLCCLSVIGLSVWLGTVLPSDVFSVRMVSLLNLPAEPHFVDRVTSWRETIIPAILENPMGYGLGTDGTHERALYFSHNGYFYIAIEMGLLGLLAGLVALCRELPRLWRVQFRQEDPFIQATATMLIAWITALLVMGSFGAMLEVYPVNFYTWFLLGAMSQIVGKERRSGRGRQSDSSEVPFWASI